MSKYITLYDTTCRDGAQTDGVDFSVADKTAISTKLDLLGIDYIEGGWNGANPTDSLFFNNLPKLNKSQFCTFGMTGRLTNNSAFEKWCQTPVDNFTMVGKTWDFHVTEALGISLEENLLVIQKSVEALVSKGKRVFFDAEHFFDGYKNNRDYALKCLQTAFKAGAKWIVLCETNGGCLPFEIEQIILDVLKYIPGENLGIHCHNDTGNAIANSLTAVRAGVCQVQGTINGLGERCGNADLMVLIPNLVFKMGYETNLSEKELKLLVSTSNFLYDKLNQSPKKNQPYVGTSSFTHKGGLHVSAINKNPKSYEHINPDLIGNQRKILISGQSGKSNIISLLTRLEIPFDEKDAKIGELLDLVKRKEHQGFSYDSAEASFEILARSFLFGLPKLFDLEAFRVVDERRHNKKGLLEMMSDATIRITVQNKEFIEADIGNGPVDALVNSLLKVLKPLYPSLKDFKLHDYRVRIFDSEKGTGANTRVTIEATNGKGNYWSTVGISSDIIDASFQAISDSLLYCHCCLK